ncbi:MAG: type I methionyl aminopeptidase [Candidatus Omnitrophica bacterium]|nr:type I methionyl aminopeptidase [Candidatus Omnitrophota bacterium]
MIEIKAEHEIDHIKDAGTIIKKVFKVLSNNIRPGISTFELDKTAEEIIRNEKGIPAFKGFMGYPATICSSVNESVVHEIPSKKRILKDGDIIGVDIGVGIGGFFADSAYSFVVGNIPDHIKMLLKVTEESLYKGIEQACDGNRVSDISHAIGSFVEKQGFSVVRQFVGHGIGRNIHEEPEIPNFGEPGRGPRLKAGMVIAIEPMVNCGSCEVRILPDGWTAVTVDGSISAHFEHTVVIRKGKAEIVT